MKQTMRTKIVLRGAVTVFGLSLLVLSGGTARAHCDTMIGPVVTQAKAALEKGDVTPVLKWVLKEKEAEIKTASRAVR